ncbi:hypothetical protein ACOMHN_048610 [Nucella lapillus]
MEDSDGESQGSPTNRGDKKPSLKRGELSYMVTLYQAMVDAVVTGIQVYAQSASLSQAQSKVRDEMNEGCQSIITSALSAYLSDKDSIRLTVHMTFAFLFRSKVLFTVESVHKHGSVEEAVDGHRSALTKVATLTLLDTPPPHPPPPPQGPWSSRSAFWTLLSPSAQASGSSHEDHREVKGHLEGDMVKRLGSLLMAGDKVDITAGSELTLPPETVQLYVYQNGVAVYSEHYGSFALSAADCSHVHLFDGDSMSTAVLLILTYHTWSAGKLPPHLYSSDNMLFLVITPHTKTHNHLYGQVLTSWKEDSEMPPISRIDREDLPEQLDALHHYLQQVNQLDSVHNLLMAPHATSLTEAAHNLPHLPEFLKHLSVSSAIPNAVSRSDLPHLLQQEPAFDVTSDNEQVVVTVLTGVPGSEKQSLCNALSKLGTTSIRWVVVRQMEEALLDAGQIQRMLASAVSSHLKQDKNKRQTRVLLVTPG